MSDDVQAHSGDVWIEEVDLVVINELYEGLAFRAKFMEVPGQKA